MLKTTIGCIGFLFFVSQSAAQVPSRLSLGGTLSDANGEVLETGTYDLLFKLWADTDTTQLVWSETKTGLQVTNGYYETIIGPNGGPNPLSDLHFAEACWLTITVTDPGPPSSSWPLGSVVELTATPFSLNARRLASNTDAIIRADANADGSGDVIFNTGTTERLRLSQDGYLGLGLDDPQTKFHLRTQDTDPFPAIVIDHWDGGNNNYGVWHTEIGYGTYMAYANRVEAHNAASLNFVRSRGNVGKASPTRTVADNDILGKILFFGADGGSAFHHGATIQAVVDGVASPGTMPTRLEWLTTTGSGAPLMGMALDGNGRLGIGTMDPDHALELGTGTYSEADPGDLQFSTSSHSSFKENFQGVDKAAVAASFGQLTVQRYTFRADFLRQAHAETFARIEADTSVTLAQRRAARDQVEALIQRRSAKPRVGLMADDFYPIAQALNPDEADETKLSGDLVQTALVIMVQEQQQQIADLTARIAVLEGQ